MYVCMYVDQFYNQKCNTIIIIVHLYSAFYVIFKGALQLKGTH